MNEPKLLVMRLVDASTQSNTLRLVYRVNDRRVSIEIDPCDLDIPLWYWRVYVNGEHKKSGESITMGAAHEVARKFLRDTSGR